MLDLEAARIVVADHIAELERLVSSGSNAEAQVLCDSVCKAAPENGRAWYASAILSMRTDDITKASQEIGRATRLAPNDVQIHIHATEIHRRAGALELAAIAGQRAVELAPRECAAFNNFALVLQAQNKVNDAEKLFRSALDIDPDYVRAWLNLGILLLQRGDLLVADTCLQQALRRQPNYPQALNALAQIRRRQFRHEEAHQLLRQALHSRPNYHQAWLNLANTLADMGDLEGGSDALKKALQIKPNYAEALHDLGAHYEHQKQYDKAVEQYAKALSVEPDSTRYLASLENARRQICDWRGWPRNLDRILQATRESIENDTPAPLWPLSSCRFPTSSADRLGVARQQAQKIGRAANKTLHRFRFPTGKNNKAPLRIGFLSHEFCNHVVSHLMCGLFSRFDRQRFIIYAFDYSKADKSALRLRVIDGVDEFISVVGLSPQQAAERIAEEDIHILLDINSYMSSGRPEICAWRPAPIQVSYMYPASTGADWIDYFLADRIVCPDGHETFFSEALVYLPDAYLPTDHDQPVSEFVPERSAIGLPEDCFVFCSFNSCDKIEPDLFDVWMRILRRVPDSVLWQKDGGQAAQTNLRNEARARGVDPGRILFAGRVSNTADYLSRLRCADLFLDTKTHGAHGTAVDALWAGLPFLTCAGETFTSRVGASLVNAAGVPELAVDDFVEYENTAVELATNRAKLRRIRDHLDKHRQRCALFDTGRLVAHLERSFVAMWDRYAAGDSAAPLSIEPIPTPDRKQDPVTSGRKAVAHRPDDAHAWHDLAVALRGCGKRQAAYEAWQKATALQPEFTDAWMQMGKLLKDGQRLYEAQCALERAHELSPENPESLFLLATQVYPTLGDWEKGIPALRELVERYPNDPRYHSSLLMIMQYDGRITADEIAHEHRRWNERHGAIPRVKLDNVNYDPDRQLRIGFVSGDFKHHAVAYFLRPLLRQLSKADWQVVCYSSLPSSRADDYTREFQALAA
ncbi:MAG: tetratricopeptide repeat protein, partial [Gammaproteobacteria bacterium]|nr:tetratricopeptide repeat protein [Gammaproteobacteria bacterium]